MKYLKLFESIRLTESQKFSIIDKIINDEVSKSKEKFDYDIEEKDIELEKKTFKDSILMIWDDIETSDNGEYQDLMRFIFEGVKNIFRYEYYRDRDVKLDVKNNYQVHVSCVVYSIFMVISNKLYSKYL